MIFTRFDYFLLSLFFFIQIWTSILTPEQQRSFYLLSTGLYLTYSNLFTILLAQINQRNWDAAATPTCLAIFTR